MLDTLPRLTLSLALALLFAAALAHKLRARAAWAESVREYQLLPDSLTAAVAWLLPLAEALTLLLLLYPPTRRAGALLAAGLLLAYAGAVGLNLRRGRRFIDCGCFGAGHRRGIGAWMVWRNLSLALLALALLLPSDQRALGALEQAAALICALTLAFLLPVLEVVLAAPPPTFDQNLRASRAQHGH